MLLTRSPAPSPGSGRQPALDVPRQERRIPAADQYRAEALQEANVSGGDSAGSSSMDIRNPARANRAQVTAVRRPTGSCGMVSAKVRETCGRIWSG